MQLMFQTLGAGDKAGSGIDRIRASWAAEHWQSPELRETLRPDRVLLELPMVSLLPEAVLTDLRSRFGPAFGELTGDEVQAVAMAREEGLVTNQHLQGMLTMHRVDITRMLGNLVRRGFLVSDGAGRGTRYFVAGEGAPPLSAGAPPLSAVGAELPDDDIRWTIAAPVRERQRVKPEVMRQTIRALCVHDFLTLQQLAVLLDRGSKGLQEDHLTPMSRSGELQLRFPDHPNHPQQGYRAASPKKTGAVS